MLKEEKGITLVALIITIIVLIILAAVTIMSFRESGIMNTAVNGTINYAKAQEDEKIKMDQLDDDLQAILQRINSIQNPAPSVAPTPTNP